MYGMMWYDASNSKLMPPCLTNGTIPHIKILNVPVFASYIPSVNAAVFDNDLIRIKFVKVNAAVFDNGTITHIIIRNVQFFTSYIPSVDSVWCTIFAYVLVHPFKVCCTLFYVCCICNMPEVRCWQWIPNFKSKSNEKERKDCKLYSKKWMTNRW